MGIGRLIIESDLEDCNDVRSDYKTSVNRNTGMIINITNGISF